MPSIKLIIKSTAVVAMLVVAFGPFSILQQTPKAHAQDATGVVPIGANYNTTSGTLTTPQGNQAGAAGPKLGDDTGCSLGTLFTQCVASLVYWIGPGFASWVLSGVAYFFDFIVKISLNSTAYALGFLTKSWTLVLNLANMFFIFILIYTAFVIMLRAETARTMQILAWVIAIALVVNFSFFFTRVVIDAGNILAVQFYNGITATASNARPVNPNDSTSPPDITAGIMDAVGVTQLLGSNSFSYVQKNTNTSSLGTMLTLSVVYLSVAVVFWILALSLLMAAVKFFLRIVGLWFVLIASPIAFVSKTLPKTQHFFDMWLRTLVSFAFYPAIFLFMFLVLNWFLQDMAGGNLINAIFNQNTSAGSSPYPLLAAIANVFVRMGFVVVMMYVMLKVADWIMEQTGGLANTLVSKAGSAVLGAGFRGAATMGAFAGRNTVGRGAFRLADTAAFKKFAGSSALGNALWRGTAGIGKATFDVRNAPGGSVIKKGASKIVGDVNVGKATARSFDKTVSDREKEIKKRAEALKASETEKVREQDKFENEHSYNGMKGSAAYSEHVQELTRQLNTAKAGGNKGEIKNAESALSKLTDGGKKVAEAAQKERITALATRVGSRNISNLGVPSMGSIRGAVAALKVAKGKSPKDEIFDKLKEVNKEEDEGSTSAASAAPASGATGHDTPGAGPSAFSGGTQHELANAIKETGEMLHKDNKKILSQEHKIAENVQHVAGRNTSSPGLVFNPKEISERVAKSLGEHLQPPQNFPPNTREIKNGPNPTTVTQQLKDQNPEEKK